MKVFSISDLHLSLCGEKPMEIFEGWDNYLESIRKSWLEQVTEDDIVVIAGDISWAMRLEGFKKDVEFLTELPGHKIIVRGNHDYWWSGITKVRSALPPKIYALQNDCLRIGKYLFCGTRGWTVPERNQVLNKEDDKILKRELIRVDLSLCYMDKMRKKDDLVIFVMHYPPFDSARTFDKFTKMFESHKVDIVIYGHLHGKNIRCINYEKRNDIEYYLTSTDQIGHKLILISTEKL